MTVSLLELGKFSRQRNTRLVPRYKGSKGYNKIENVLFSCRVFSRYTFGRYMVY